MKLLLCLEAERSMLSRGPAGARGFDGERRTGGYACRYRDRRRGGIRVHRYRCAGIAGFAADTNDMPSQEGMPDPQTDPYIDLDSDADSDADSNSNSNSDRFGDSDTLAFADGHSDADADPRLRRHAGDSSKQPARSSVGGWHDLLRSGDVPDHERAVAPGRHRLVRRAHGHRFRFDRCRERPRRCGSHPNGHRSEVLADGDVGVHVR